MGKISEGGQHLKSHCVLSRHCIESLVESLLPMRLHEKFKYFHRKILSGSYQSYLSSQLRALRLQHFAENLRQELELMKGL